MHFLTRSASKNLRTAKGEAEWNRRWAEYEKHFQSIKSSLTNGWRLLGETDFHDTVVWSVERPRKSEIILQVDMTPRWEQPPLRICTLRFIGVLKADIPDEVTHGWWLYNEIDRVQEGCGELRVLLRESEFCIAACDVEYTTNYKESA
jgi:hypothetical protein